MGMTDRLRGAWSALVRSDWPTISIDEYLGYLNTMGNLYPLGLNQTLTGNKEEIEAGYTGFVQSAYERNGIVFACIAARVALFSQARFQFQQMRKGTPGDLFGTNDLALLERPFGPGSTTSDLLGRMLVYADLGGTVIVTKRRDQLRVLRPDWVTLVLGSESDETVQAGDLDADLLGVVYHPGGRNSGRAPVPLLRDQFAYFAPYPDPLAQYRGISWLTPIVREVAADSSATTHKLQFFQNGATPNMVVTLDKDSKSAISTQSFKEWVAAFKENEPTGYDVYKTLFLTSASVDVVGKDLQQLDFKVTQGAGETRIAAASGMHPVIVGLSEGLQGSSLNTGNFAAARRLVVDKTLWHLWANVAGSLEVLFPAPSGSRLWIDADIPFLREDRKDAAEIQFIKSQTLRQYLDGGFEADAAIAAVEAGDEGLLKGKHTGLFSVQLQAPGSTKMPAGEVPGEQPVAEGTGPETIPAGDVSTKPVSAGSTKPTNGSKP